MPADLRELLRRRLSGASAIRARRPRSSRRAPLNRRSRSSRRVEGGATGLAEAEDAGIVLVRGTAIEFTHPLFASTVYETRVCARPTRRSRCAREGRDGPRGTSTAPGALCDRTERGGRPCPRGGGRPRRGEGCSARRRRALRAGGHDHPSRGGRRPPAATPRVGADALRGRRYARRPRAHRADARRGGARSRSGADDVLALLHELERPPSREEGCSSRPSRRSVRTTTSEG